jgi:hypothetical protein
MLLNYSSSLPSRVRRGLIFYVIIVSSVLSLRWLHIDFTKCGVTSWNVTPREAHVLRERLEVLRNPVIQAKYLRIGQVTRELNKAVKTVDNPYVYFKVRTNGTPWIETISINGQQACKEGLAGQFIPTQEIAGMRVGYYKRR